MLDFLGFIATAALMVLAVNAVITFMDVSPSAKLTLATLAGLWIALLRPPGPGKVLSCGHHVRRSLLLPLKRALERAGTNSVDAALVGTARQRVTSLRS